MYFSMEVIVVVLFVFVGFVMRMRFLVIFRMVLM